MMMTNDIEIKRRVLSVLNRWLPAGKAATKKDWRFAYDMVRKDAIEDTIAWKQRHITIEEPLI